MSQPLESPHTSLPCRTDDGILPHPPRMVLPRHHHWLTILLLLGALLAMGWWFQQRTSALSSQLVATQDSFALISEQASAERSQMASRLDNSHLQSADRQTSLRLQQLELAGRLDELQARLTTLQPVSDSLAQLQAGQLQQEQRFDALQAMQSEHASQFSEQLAQLDDASQRQQQQLAALQPLQQAQQQVGERLQALEQQDDPQPRLSALESQLEVLTAGLQQFDQQLAAREAAHAQQLDQLEALQQSLQHLAQQQGQLAGKDELQRLADELLVVRSALEKRPAGGISRREFDSFRQQTTRHITTLQTQWRNLQNQR